MRKNKHGEIRIIPKSLNDEFEYTLALIKEVIDKGYMELYNKLNARLFELAAIMKSYDFFVDDQNMTKFIVYRSVNENDVKKFPGAKIVAFENGWYIIHIPVRDGVV